KGVLYRRSRSPAAARRPFPGARRPPARGTGTGNPSPIGGAPAARRRTRGAASALRGRRADAVGPLYRPAARAGYGRPEPDPPPRARPDPASGAGRATAESRPARGPGPGSEPGSEQGVRQRPAGLRHGRVVDRQGLEQAEQVQPYLVALVA